MIRQLRHGEAPPDGEPRRFRSASGYIRLRWKVAPTEYVECYEHRHVVGAYDPDTHVHHINGVKDDNRPENLEVLTPAEHKAKHAQYDAEEFVELYQSGLSLPAIARRTGADTATILRALRRVGVPTRSLGESQRMGLDDDLLRKLNRAGVRNRRIAQALGVSPSLIDKRVREMGLPAPPTGRPTDEERRKAEAAIAELVTR